MKLSKSSTAETSKALPSQEALSGFADIKFKSIGVAVIVPIKDAGIFVRGFIAAGESYSVHPLDVVDADGDLVGLPTTRGLMPSRYSDFAWQIASRRRLLTVPMAKHELQTWADVQLGT
jgi:hypothetical protein